MWGMIKGWIWWTIIIDELSKAEYLTCCGKSLEGNNSRQNNNNLANQKLHSESKPPPHIYDIMWLLIEKHDTTVSVTTAASPPLIKNIGYRKRKGNDVNGAALVRAQSYITSLLAVCFQTHILKKYIRYIAWNSYNIWRKMCGVWFSSFTDPGNAEFVQHPKKYCVRVCVCVLLYLSGHLSACFYRRFPLLLVCVCQCVCV